MENRHIKKHLIGSAPASAGLTIVEMVISIAIFTVAMGAVVLFVVTIYRTQSFVFEQSLAVNESRRGIETMVAEIREARTGENGSYLIEKANDNEFVFYSDIDQDNSVERVRYFRGGMSAGLQTKECVTFTNGGSCSVNFSNFLSGTLQSGSVMVSVEGDFGASNEYAELFADTASLGRICQFGCTDCAGFWGGSTSFDIAAFASDGNFDMTADATSQVGSTCNWIDPNHSMKAKFDFSWIDSQPGTSTVFMKGVTQSVGFPPVYDLNNEEISTLSEYIRNTSTPIFKYYDKEGNEITNTPARPEETTLMRVNLIINVNPDRAPEDFELESDIQLRNLKTNL